MLIQVLAMQCSGVAVQGEIQGRACTLFGTENDPFEQRPDEIQPTGQQVRGDHSGMQAIDGDAAAGQLPGQRESIEYIRQLRARIGRDTAVAGSPIVHAVQVHASAVMHL